MMMPPLVMVMRLMKREEKGQARVQDTPRMKVNHEWQIIAPVANFGSL